MLRSPRVTVPLARSALLVLLFAGAPLPAASAEHVDDATPGDGALAPDERLVSGTLDNGLRYTVATNDRPAGALSIRLRVGSGSLDEADDRSGLAHFLEHMAFNGSDGIPEGELIPMLAARGAAFGRHNNAWTDFDETGYQLDFPRSDEETLDTALFVMREFASNMTLDEAAVGRERGIILAEHRTRTNPGLRAFAAEIALALPETDYPDHLSVGDLDDPADIVAIDAASLRDYYERHYVPSNTALVVVGDAPVPTLVAAIERHFGDWRGEPATEATPGRVDPDRPAAARVHVEPALPSGLTVSFVDGEPPEDTRRAREEGIALDVALALLARRLERAANREEAGILDGAAGRDASGSFVHLNWLQAAVADGDWQAATSLLASTLKEAQARGFSPDEVASELDAVRADVEAAALGADARTSAELADELVTDIHEERVSTSPADDLALFERVAATLDADGVREALKRGTSISAPLLFLVTPSPIEGAGNALLERWEEAMAAPLAAATEVPDGELGYARFGDPGELVADAREDALGVRRLRFGNGVAANLLATDHAPGQVVVSLRVGRGAIDLAGTPPGLTTLMEDAFVAGGLGEHPIDEIERLTAGDRIELGFGVGEDHFGGTYETRAADLERQLRLLAAYLVDPGYRVQAERRFHRAREEMDANLRSAAGAVAFHRVPTIVHGDDARFGLPPLAALRAVGFDDLRAALDEPFGTGAIEIGIVGDVDEAAAIEALANTFGALPERAPPAAPEEDALAVRFPTGEHRTLVHEGDADDAAIVVAWSTGDAEDASRIRLQQVLEAVFVTRLDESVRERMGATYSPQSESRRSRTFPDFGYLGFYVEALPDALATVRDAVLDIADELGGERPVTATELARAVTPLLADIETEREDNAQLSYPVSVASSRPREVARFAAASDELGAVTAEALTRFAAETFGGEPLIVEIEPAGAEPDASTASGK